jgi:hypothetical protein
VFFKPLSVSFFVHKAYYHSSNCALLHNDQAHPPPEAQRAK